MAPQQPLAGHDQGMHNKLSAQEEEQQAFGVVLASSCLWPVATLRKAIMLDHTQLTVH